MKEDFEKELQELSPFLADLKKKQNTEPFKTPRLYFDTLADKIVEKANSASKVLVTAPPQYNQPLSLLNRVSGWLSTVFQPRLALSALALAVVFGAGWYVINHQQSTTSVNTNEPTVVMTEAIEPVTTEEVGEYVNKNIDDFKEEEILLAMAEPKKMSPIESVLDVRTFDSTPNKPEIGKIPTHPKSGLTEEEIEEYLKENLDEGDLDIIGGKL